MAVFSSFIRSHISDLITEVLKYATRYLSWCREAKSTQSTIIAIALCAGKCLNLRGSSDIWVEHWRTVCRVTLSGYLYFEGLGLRPKRRKWTGIQMTWSEDRDWKLILEWVLKVRAQPGEADGAAWKSVFANWRNLDFVFYKTKLLVFEGLHKSCILA